MKTIEKFLKSIWKKKKTKRIKPFELPKKFAEEWLSKLRSGEYPQAEGALYSYQQQGFCCLGVAITNVISKEDVIKLCKEADFAMPIQIMEEVEYHGEDISINNVEIPLAIYSEDEHLASILARLNDGLSKEMENRCKNANPNIIFNIERKGFQTSIKYSFEDIADFIELNTKFV